MTTLDESQGRKRRLSRKLLLRILLILLFLCAIGAVAYFAYTLYRNSYGAFSGYEVVTKMERKDESSSTYVGYNGLLLKYSRDGATAMDASGKYLWNGSYEMKDPMIDYCGDYVAVADRGSKLVHIFNGNGSVNNITVEHPILQIQVANQGVIMVMSEEDNIIYLSQYSATGKLLWEDEKPIKLSGYPLSMALSNDGNRLVYSCLDVSSGTVKTNTAWYNYGDVGQNSNHNIVAGIAYDGIAAKVDFITNHVVAIYRNQGFSLYAMEQKPAASPIVEVEFETGIQSIFSSSSYVGFVLESASEKYKYQVVVYDTKGNKILDQGMNYEYSDIQVYGSDIIFYNYASCYIMNTKGTVRFQYDFEESIDSMFGAGKNKYYVVSGSNIEIIRLKGAK